MTDIFSQVQSMQNHSFSFFLTIFLQLGDPTSSGNFQPCPVVESVIVQEVGTGSAGYVNALGTDALRERIALFHSQMGNSVVQARVVDPSHVIVASGCSGALDIALRALLDPGTYLLVPNPGFPLYQVIAESIGAHVLPYNLLPDEEWEVDLNHVETLVKSAQMRGMEIRGIVVNNPSNPTGAVYTLEHLQGLVRACDEFCLPIVADEIYGDLTYVETRPFIPLANVAATIDKNMNVPVMTCSGIGKQFLVPGWRLGWLVFHDNDAQSLQEVEQGSKQLAQIVLGASHPAQTMATQILEAHVTKSEDMMLWEKALRSKLSLNAALVQEKLARTPGLFACSAQGAMYVMVTFDPQHFDFISEGNSPGEQFSTKLLEEENVFVLPGSCFGMPNAFRIVFCATETVLEQAMLRIFNFSRRHFTDSKAED